jgi:hypothetical protein
MAENKTPWDMSLVWVMVGTIVFAAIVIYIVHSVMP